jgi:hypothetical protein
MKIDGFTEDGEADGESDGEADGEAVGNVDEGEAVGDFDVVGNTVVGKTGERLGG